jgi:hypothetical protein
MCIGAYFGRSAHIRMFIAERGYTAIAAYGYSQALPYKWDSRPKHKIVCCLVIKT